MLDRHFKLVRTSDRHVHGITIERQTIRIPVRHVDRTRHLRSARISRRTPPQTHRHRRRTVIRIPPRNHLERTSLTRQRLILLRHLHRRLNRLRSTRKEKRPSILVVVERRDPTSQFDLRRRRRVRRWGFDARQLLIHRIRYLRPPITRSLVPQPTHRIEHAITLDVFNPRTPSFDVNLQIAAPIFDLLRVHEEMIAGDALQLFDSFASTSCFGHDRHWRKPPIRQRRRT